VWCFSCHYGGTQISLLYELSKVGFEFDFAQALRAVSLEGPGDFEDFDFSYDELRNVQEVEPFPEWYVDNFEKAYFEGRVHPYLELEREVPYEFAEKWDLRYDPHRHRICFPIRDYHGKLTGVHGRAIGDQEPRYLVYTHETRSNPNVWLGEHLVDRNEPVVFVESVFDLARVWEVYENVMSPLRSGINAAQLSRVRWARNVICFFDNDEAGHHAFERVKDGFRKEKAWNNVFAIWPPEGRDPGNMHVRSIAELLHEHLGE
jgi:DNA primase